MRQTAREAAMSNRNRQCRLDRESERERWGKWNRQRETQSERQEKMRHTATETKMKTKRDINKRRQGQMHRGERKWMGVVTEVTGC